MIANSIQIITRSIQIITRSMQNFLPSLPLERFLDGRGDSERPPGRGRPPPNTLVEGQKPVILQTFDGLIQRTLPLTKEKLLTKCHYTRKQRLSEGTYGTFLFAHVCITSFVKASYTSCNFLRQSFLHFLQLPSSKLPTARNFIMHALPELPKLPKTS